MIIIYIYNPLPLVKHCDDNLVILTLVTVERMEKVMLSYIFFLLVSYWFLYIFSLPCLLVCGSERKGFFF